MIYNNQAAFDFLNAKSDQDDVGASSHWKEQHLQFRFLGDRFEGLQGFGGNQADIGGLLSLYHRFMQRRFRKLGAGYPSFSSIDDLGSEITRSQSRIYDLDVLRQTLTLGFIEKFVPKDSQSTACVIGDGFASLTSLLLASRFVGRVVLVNLTKTLLVDLWYLKLWMGSDLFESAVDLVTSQEALVEALGKPLSKTKLQVIAIQAENHELIKDCPIDLAFNIASMAEMDPPLVDAYFDDLRYVAARRKLHFYCCNRAQKTLPDGTVTSFKNYPWCSDDIIHVDELCPWHKEYYDYSSPFFKPYDGPICHRLVNLASAKD